MRTVKLPMDQHGGHYLEPEWLKPAPSMTKQERHALFQRAERVFQRSKRARTLWRIGFDGENYYFGTYVDQHIDGVCWILEPGDL